MARNDRPDEPLSSNQPPPCPCSTRHPQLNTTVTGRCCGCGSCLCSRDERRVNDGATGFQQQNSSADELQGKFGALKITIVCSECCQTRVTSTSVVEHPLNANPCPPYRTEGTDDVREDPYEQTASGHFVVSPNGDSNSPEGSFLKATFEVLLHQSQTCSMAPNPPTGTRPHSPFSIAFEENRDSTIMLHLAETGLWIDGLRIESMRNGDSEVVDVADSVRPLPTILSEIDRIFDTREAQHHYPRHLEMADD